MSERDLQLRAEDPTLSESERLAKRVEELEDALYSKRISLKQLPVAALQERLHQAWQPDGDTLLLPESVGPSSLELSAQVEDASDSGAGIALTLTTSYQDVPGCSVTVPHEGHYIVIGIFDFSVTVAGAGILLGRYTENDAPSGRVAVFQPATTGRQTTPQVWLTSKLRAGSVIRLQAEKTIAAGTAIAFAFHTTLTVVGPF